MKPATFEDLNNKIKVLSNSEFIVSTSKEPTKDSEIRKIESKYNIKIPPSYREILEKMGYLMVEIKEEIWPRPQAYDIGTVRDFQYGFTVFGIAEELSPQSDLELVIEEFKDLNLGIPFFKLYGGHIAFIKEDRIILYTRNESKILEGNIYDFLQDEFEFLERDLENIKKKNLSLDQVISQLYEAKEKKEKIELIVILGKIIKKEGKSAIDKVLPVLKHFIKDEEITFFVVSLISDLGEDAETLLAEMQEMYYIGDTDDKMHIVTYLGKIRDDSDATIDILMHA